MVGNTAKGEGGGGVEQKEGFDEKGKGGKMHKGLGGGR